jgi:hypothetical protein
MACLGRNLPVPLFDSENNELRKAVKANGSPVQGTVPHVSWKEQGK